MALVIDSLPNLSRAGATSLVFAQTPLQLGSKHSFPNMRVLSTEINNLQLCSNLLEQKFKFLSSLNVVLLNGVDCAVLIKSLSVMENLTSLSLQRGRISTAASSLFGSLKGLKSLSMRSLQISSFQHLGKALKLTAIENLYASWCDLSPQSLEALLDEVQIDHIHVICKYGDYSQVDLARYRLKSCLIKVANVSQVGYFPVTLFNRQGFLFDFHL